MRPPLWRCYRHCAVWAAAPIRCPRLCPWLQAPDPSSLTAYTTISGQAAAVMAAGSFPLGVSAVALGRVGDLMQTEYALSKSVNVARLAREMTSQ
jgi:hypothetical protein